MIDLGSGPWMWAVTVVSGALLGAVFFGGLWWTVRRGAGAANPALWFFASLIARTAIVLLGFYFVGGGQPLRLALCLLGFLLARTVVLRMTQPRAALNAPPASGAPPCA